VGLRLPASPPVIPLPVAMIELPFRALLVSPVGAPPLFAKILIRENQGYTFRE
jgi:hypothetical protein